MIPVYQSIVHQGDGDCFRASTASLLDLTLEQVPHFGRYKQDWFHIYYGFMRLFGYEYSEICSINAKRGMRLEDSVNGFFETTVPSATFENVTHSVVTNMDGLIVHDPNPNKKYLNLNIYDLEDKSHVYWYMFEKISEGE